MKTQDLQSKKYSEKEEREKERSVMARINISPQNIESTFFSEKLITSLCQWTASPSPLPLPPDCLASSSSFSLSAEGVQWKTSRE